VDYCSENYDGGELEEFILEIDPEKLDHDKRNKLIELLIRRNNIPKATSYINKFGYSAIDRDLLLMYVNEMLKNESADADERLLNICRYLFVHNKFDSTTLSYLRKYYVGPTDEMYDMWKACRSNGISDMLFAERLIVQMIFEQRNENRMLELFIAFHCNESGRNIKKAFFTYFSYIYFNTDKSADKEFFNLLEEDMMDGMRVSEICKMAYLYYITKQEDVSKEQIKLCKDLIYELTEINIVFEFYKEFGKWFRMPYSILDKTIIDYRTNPRNKVFITYRVYDEEGKVGDVNTEEMSSVYPGIFVKKLTLFYGEKVAYTIIDKDTDDGEQLKEHTIHMTRKDAYNEDNKFGQINGMLISQEVGRGDALDELMKNYEFYRQASEELFKLL